MAVSAAGWSVRIVFRLMFEGLRPRILSRPRRYLRPSDGGWIYLADHGELSDEPENSGGDCWAQSGAL
jgi:hypothetical protein